ncbi:MAG: DUF3307 domain-containing protein [Candidatus Marinimicrobia bacterium]|nr:DUF3307 domain-containing protein [Candidatus Neomarinimicrobiota bacterium]
MERISETIYFIIDQILHFEIIIIIERISQIKRIKHYQAYQIRKVADHDMQ